MALSGNFQNYPVSSFGLYCDWNASQSVTGNYSSVTLNVYLSYYTIGVGARDDGNVNINGSSQTYGTAAINDYSTGWKKKLLKTHTVTVPHNSDGTKSCSISASWRFGGTYSGVSIGTITASTTITLNTIDRAAPTVSLSTSSITPSSVYISASASTTCDIWDYSKDNGSTWTQFSTASATSATTTITGLSPNTSYTIKVRARKKSNQVYGTSGGATIKTLGPAILNSVSTLTADSDTSTLTYNWTVYSTSFTYTLAVKNGSTVITTISIPAQTGTGTSDKTLTLSSAQRSAILSAMASLKSFTATFDLVTLSGSSQVGSTSSKTATVQTTAANSAPTFSNAAGFTYLDNNSTTATVTENNQIMVQDYSRLLIDAYTANAKNSAKITKYEAIINDAVVSSSSTSLSVGAVSKSGSLTLTVRAIDSRGYSVAASKTITVAAYKAADITDVQMRRVNEVEALTQILLDADMSKILVSNVNKNGFVSLRYRYKQTSASSYSTYMTIAPSSLVITDTSVSFDTNEFIPLDTDYSYDIQFNFADKITSDTFDVVLPQGTPLISRRRKKVGINNRKPQAALDVVGGAIIDGAAVLTESNIKAGYYDGNGNTNRTISIASVTTDSFVLVFKKPGTVYIAPTQPGGFTVGITTGLPTNDAGLQYYYIAFITPTTNFEQTGGLYT